MTSQHVDTIRRQLQDAAKSRSNPLAGILKELDQEVDKELLMEAALSASTSSSDHHPTEEPIDLTKNTILRKLLAGKRKRRFEDEAKDEIEVVDLTGEDEVVDLTGEDEDEEVTKKRGNKAGNKTPKKAFLKECEIPLDSNNHLFIRIKEKTYLNKAYSSFCIVKKNEYQPDFIFEMKRAYIIPVMKAMQLMLQTSSLTKEVIIDYNGRCLVNEEDEECIFPTMRFQSRVFQPISVMISPGEFKLQIEPEPSIVGCMCLSFCRQTKANKIHPFRVSLFYLPAMFEALQRIVKENEDIL